MVRIGKHLPPDAPLLNADHGKPKTRREFIASGLMAGGGVVMSSTLLNLATPGAAHSLSSDLEHDKSLLRDICTLIGDAGTRIPFICFDLAGGASMTGSNVLVGRQGGQLDFLTTRGYSRLGVPSDMVPNVVDAQNGLTDHVDTSLGLAFHSDSQMLHGILERLGPGVAESINGAVIPARSENDTGNNPHNPMYGIARAGANGRLLTLIGSVNSDSGGNSMAPAMLVDPRLRPTKVDRPSDATGLVDVGDLVRLLSPEEAVAVLEATYRISRAKLANPNLDTRTARDEVIKQLVQCGYLNSANIAEDFGDPNAMNPATDPDIVGPNGIFTAAEFNGDSEFRKAASVMKLVIDGNAGAGTITMGGYDYHTGERATGEIRDLRAGRCMGACLEYAARVGVPLMLYVCSDGSVFSNGTIDNSPMGRGKGVWTGDSQQTAASFFLVYNPAGRPVPRDDGLGAARHQQLGFFRPDGSVETASSPAANNVNLLVQTIVLNYLALHGEESQFAATIPGHGLGGAAMQDSLNALQPIVSGTIHRS
jgi:hypothetical protein